MKEDVAKRCEELHLNQEETDLLLDLLGWNVKETGHVPPLSYRGLGIYRGLDWHEPTTDDRITSLCEKILGPNLPKIKADPDQFFYDRYTHRKNSRGVGTLLYQLRVKSSTTDYNFILYQPPESMYRSFISILAYFFSYKEEDGTTPPTD